MDSGELTSNVALHACECSYMGNCRVRIPYSCIHNDSPSEKNHGGGLWNLLPDIKNG